MRQVLAVLAFTLLSSCGNKIDHPDLAAGCDPAVTKCSYKPPEGATIGGGEGGAPPTGDDLADWSGQVLAFRDDYFDLGSVFTGRAKVSATGESGARVTAIYDGSAFQLTNVLKVSSNWFLVEPDANQGVLPTLTVVDTRVAKTDALTIGVTRQVDLDGIFQLSLSGEPSPERAQVVLKVVDEEERSLSGVTAQFTAEITAYRTEQTWDASEAGVTDDSGMIFLGNVPATAALSTTTVNLGGSVSARVEIQVRTGTTTVVTAIVGK